MTFWKVFVIKPPDTNHSSIMKKRLQLLAVLSLSLTVISGYGQPGGRRGGMGGPQGPQFSGSMAKLFGKNSSFSATLIMQHDTMSMPGKIMFDAGKSRLEMDMSEAKGLPPQAAAQMKLMGMTRTVIISRPDKKLSYSIFPDLQAYTETPIQDPDVMKPESDFKLDLTELGKETVDGHPCVKNKAVVTDKDCKTHESTVWNATDLKSFPVQIEDAERGKVATTSFKDVSLAKPEASQFEVPSSYKKYENMMAMMQQEMMKRMGGDAQRTPGGVQPPK